MAYLFHTHPQIAHAIPLVGGQCFAVHVALVCSFTRIVTEFAVESAVIVFQPKSDVHAFIGFDTNTFALGQLHHFFGQMCHFVDRATNIVVLQPLKH